MWVKSAHLAKMRSCGFRWHSWTQVKQTLTGTRDAQSPVLSCGLSREKAASLRGLWLRSGSGRLPISSQLLPADCAQLLKGSEGRLLLLLFYKWGKWGIERFISLSVLSISLCHGGEPDRYILSSWGFASLVRETELPQAHKITPHLRKGASLGGLS